MKKSVSWSCKRKWKILASWMWSIHVPLEMNADIGVLSLWASRGKKKGVKKPLKAAMNISVHLRTSGGAHSTILRLQEAFPNYSTFYTFFIGIIYAIPNGLWTKVQRMFVFSLLSLRCPHSNVNGDWWYHLPFNVSNICNIQRHTLKIILLLISLVFPPALHSQQFRRDVNAA